VNLAILLQVLAAVPQMATLVNTIVQDIETTFPSLPSNQKFAAASAKLQVILSAAIQDTALVQNAIQVAGPLINAAVAVFNVTGLFKHNNAAGTGNVTVTAK
jgi:hypothetical protein